MKKVSNKHPQNLLPELVASDLPPELSKPAQRALIEAGYLSLGQFTQLREDDVLKLHGMGPKSIEQIRRALFAIGKSFAE